MRFRKGEKVEVMNTKEVPMSWRVAEILSGNGHTYRVKYDSYPGMASQRTVETVSRKFLRPCPSQMQGVQNCIAGDVVEVFYEFSWKIAAILKVLEGKKETKSNKIHLQAASVQNQYLVQLLGCSEELIVDQLNIRTRQTWHDDKWILMGKSSRGDEDVISSNPSTSNCNQKMNFHTTQLNTRSKKKLKKDCTNIQDNVAFQGSPIISSRSLKRMSPYDSTIVEGHNGHAQKVRAIEKDGRKQIMVPTPLLEKVDAVAYPREILGETNMHASFKIGYNEMERGKLSDVQTESNSSDSDACSVGSCSITDQSPRNYYIPFIPLPCQETETLCSDAESCYGSSSERRSSSLPPKEEVEVSIRRLELHAYQRTLEALYASGPLSWEQEALLTNLRIMLHISNDEHLMEVKHLISAKTAFHGHVWRQASFASKGLKLMPGFAAVVLA
ncbi:hypothetical protein BUALT_Bualt10G0103800 [Buddleja alternifolia]|uniref:ENT domain-containing protein n=1 Tax=Buddleja alternifolia TaxID=168488 RepID=A0AAV6WWT9_9LAMI|nr:hypothetical protein BUALT_Bualt10G0103800 [Buddleja alternifolia]